jgi:hypothetical protein
VALAFVSEILCQIRMVKLLRIGVLLVCLHDESWQHLSVLETLKSVSSGVHEIHITFINNLSIKLRLETGVQICVREATGLCFVFKVFYKALFE